METKIQLFFLSVLCNFIGEVHAGSATSVIRGVYVCASDVMEPVLFISFAIKHGPRCGYAHPVAWRESQGRQGPAGQSRPSPAMVKSTKRIAFGADQPSAFRLPWLRFSVIFLSCKADVRVYDAKSGYDPQSPPAGAAASLKRLVKSRIPPVCDWASLGSEPRQPTNQSLSLP
jgi:hypothetical protein